MNITKVFSLPIPDVKIITYSRFTDKRGYFTEHFRRSKLSEHAQLPFTKDFLIMQANESQSKKNTIRGLHFQWSPFMGKLVRTVVGHMIDIVLDIRLHSPTFGKALLFDMPKRDEGVWIWAPPGFAHGN